MHTGPIRERYLHHIWCNQYIRAENLCTTDGVHVRVFEPGRMTVESGPDIRGARVQIGETVYSGDIEIHRTTPEWDTHGHDRDPRYNSVILHVVLETPPSSHTTRTLSGRVLPVLVLKNVLAGDLEAIRRDAVLDEQGDREGTLLCSGFNGRVPVPIIDRWIDRLAVERFEIKLRRYDERLRELARTSRHSVREATLEWGRGNEESERDSIPPPHEDPTLMDLTQREIWEQLLYEGLMEGFGYSRNRKQFLRIATALSLDRLRSLSLDSLQTESVLLGVAGLLPSEEECTDVESRTYGHLLRTEWERLRGLIPGDRLIRSEWVQTPTRPLNTPLLRLVAARESIRKILHQDLFRSIIHTIRNAENATICRSRLHTLLAASPGPYWERRSSFSRILPQRVHPLGQGRLDDLVVNCLFPLSLLYARTFRDPSLREKTVEILSEYPATQQNAITRRMERQLLKGRIDLTFSARQQGVIQLFNYYCREGRCRECDIGRIVWGS